MVASQEFKNNLAKIIFEKRQKMNLSQREFARHAQILSHATIAAWEKGHYLDYPERETLEKVSNHIFQVDVDTFIKWLESSKSKIDNNNLCGSILLECEKLTEEEDCLKVIKALVSRIERLKKEKN